MQENKKPIRIKLLSMWIVNSDVNGCAWIDKEYLMWLGIYIMIIFLFVSLLMCIIEYHNTI